MDSETNEDSDEDSDSKWGKSLRKVTDASGAPVDKTLKQPKPLEICENDQISSSREFDNSSVEMSEFWECAVPEEMDVGNLFSNGQRFVIDGEGLVLELIHHPTLAYGQCLQFVYLLESYLNQFLLKNGKFEVVFFEAFKLLWKTHRSASFALLCRQIAMTHLTTGLGITVRRFENIWTAEWFSYLRGTASVFLLLSDLTVCPCYMSSPLRCSFCKLYRGLQLSSIDMETDCVFMSPMRSTASQIFAYFLVAQEFAHVVQSSSLESRNLWLQFMKSKTRGSRKDVDFDQYNEVDVSNDATARLEFWAAVCRALPKENGCQTELLELLHFVLLHACLLPLLPLELRCLRLNISSPLTPTLDHAINELMICAASCLPKVANRMTGSVLTDLFDYRLIVKLLQIADVNAKEMDVSDLPTVDQLAQKIKEVDYHFGVVNVREMQAGDRIQFGKTCVLHWGGGKLEELKDLKRLQLRHLLQTTRSIVAEARPWIPVKIPELSHLFPDVYVETAYFDKDDPRLAKTLDGGRQFDETYHWHSGRPLSDDYSRTRDNTSVPPSDDWQRRRWLKSKQKYSRYMQFYGESLEGGGIELANIVVDSHPKSGKAIDKRACKVSGRKKAEVIIAQNIERLHLQRDIPADQAAWENCEKNLIFSTKESYLNAMHEIDRFMKLAKTTDYRFKALKRKIQDSFKAWSTFEYDRDVLILILEASRLMYEKYFVLIQKDANGHRMICSVLKEIGFSKGLRLFSGDENVKLAKAKNLVKPNEDISFDRFQLEFMGERLSKEDLNEPDPRVEHFIPDVWQRKLLDVVDRRESAIIVAPTSSGKTYVSYYCMEQVLRESNDGVVVYVSPTKAIVNQAAATVYARFRGKVMPPGRAVYGVFTRDYRQDALNCQVLLTVPECLRILMLSPHRQDWVKKIRYVIFDEVHCIGDGHDGKVWEQLLLLVRCPFLALSATIANPEDFLHWLKTAWALKKKQQRNISTEIHLIIHNERYCDLQKFVVTFNAQQSSGDSMMQLNPVHPAALATGGISDADVHLSPQEVVRFYDSVKKVYSTGTHPVFQDCNLETFFEKDVFITRGRVREFDKKLKHIVQQLQEDCSESLQAVYKALGSEVFNPNNKQICFSPKGATDTTVRKTTISLLNMLMEKRMLPAILFIDSQYLVEKYANVVLDYFERKESRRREKADEKRKLTTLMKQFDREKKQAKRIRDAESAKITGENKTTRVDETLDAEGGGSFSALFNCYPDCTLAAPGKLNEQDKNWIFKDRLRFLADNNPLVRCLKRGIGYHHAGMNNKLRSSVECLFRRGYLQFAFATGTLALGVHMPCKTVIFFQDSQWLSPLQYRQRSGRAGRRGYDMCGNVVFCGLPKNKVRRLMTAEIPSLQGQFPLSISDVLRFLLLLAKADDKQYAQHQIEVLLQVPFVSITAKAICRQVQFFFLFAVQILSFQGLIDLTGRPLELAGITTHLHYHDPYNLLFVYLLRKGLFHDLCTSYCDDDGVLSSEGVHELLVVLCHLFGRLRVHSSAIEMHKELCTPNSNLVLESFPEPFLSVVETYTLKVKQMISVYLHSAAKSDYVNASKERFVLPISKIDFSDKMTTDNNCQFALLNELKETVAANNCFPQFMSLSGYSDDELIEILVNEGVSTGASVYLDQTLLPVINSDLKLNSYIIDFYNHGSLRCLRMENFIKGGQIYSLLFDFNLVLKSITVSLSEMSTSANETEPGISSTDPLYRAFLYVSEEFAAKFNKAFPWTERRE